MNWIFASATLKYDDGDRLYFFEAFSWYFPSILWLTCGDVYLNLIRCKRSVQYFIRWFSTFFMDDADARFRWRFPMCRNKFTQHFNFVVFSWIFIANCLILYYFFSKSNEIARLWSLTICGCHLTIKRNETMKMFSSNDAQMKTNHNFLSQFNSSKSVDKQR